FSTRQRCDLVVRTFGGRVSAPSEALLAVLARRGRLDIIREVAAQLRKALDRRLGRIDVTVTTAFELTTAQRRAIARQLSKALGAEAVVSARVDPKLLGKAVVRIADKVYDASLARGLECLSQKLLEKIDSSSPAQADKRRDQP
ncbi:MAG: ATP synthase F1 subunit delta, partial [Planctomycetes bacterium]|nr:ATP synthase F1 subunit delta [Planctomycetota bacterium]